MLTPLSLYNFPFSSLLSIFFHKLLSDINEKKETQKKLLKATKTKMTSIFKLITENPEKYQPIFTKRTDGKIKISQGELIKVDYCMPALMTNTNGQRVPIPETETDHIPAELVSCQIYKLFLVRIFSLK